ncbi:MAG: amidohydrolase family protein [Acidobacteriota bacterium]
MSSLGAKWKVELPRLRIEKDEADVSYPVAPKSLFSFFLACSLLSLSSCQNTQRPRPADEATPGPAESKPVVKYGVPVVQGPMDALLLKDYDPQSSLVVPETLISKARVGATDVHAHAYADTPEQVAEWVRVMDETGVETTIVLTDAVGAEFDGLVDLYLKPYPTRFQLYCGLDTRNADDGDYAERVVRELERCYEKGARGVGELSDKGWGLNGSSDSPLPRNRRLHPDDARLDLFWRKCAQLKLPVNLHIADHPSCWKPLDAHQERTPDFQTFNLYGKDVPSHAELLAMRDRLLERHPQTSVIACHLSNQGHDLASLSRALSRYPNLYLDISARDYELGRQPRSALRFLAQHKDRVLFGTDMGRDKQVYLNWWRLLESADEFIPGRIWWAYYGLELPDAVLKPLYRDNARRILNWKAL